MEKPWLLIDVDGVLNPEQERGDQYRLRDGSDLRTYQEGAAQVGRGEDGEGMTQQETKVGQRWVRKADGATVEVIYLGGGAHAWVDVRRLDSGRTFTVSEAGLRRKYELISENELTTTTDLS